MVGRSIREIIWRRLRRDRVAMVCLVVLTLFYLVALAGPVVLGALGYSPYAFDKTAISNLGGQPNLPWGGIEFPAHPLGVEWGSGRDIMSQLLWGLRISLVVATTATILTVVIGTVIGIVAGYSRGWVDQALSAAGA